uniref:Salivary mucin n=1 Tax=Ornithodoros coriaceus TaxID=92741 RepID=B2D2D2_ORNCO|nr:salivary mucin [Ornithodoros coriaceus]
MMYAAFLFIGFAVAAQALAMTTIIPKSVSQAIDPQNDNTPISGQVQSVMADIPHAEGQLQQEGERESSKASQTSVNLDGLDISSSDLGQILDSLPSLDLPSLGLGSGVGTSGGSSDSGGSSGSSGGFSGSGGSSGSSGVSSGSGSFPGSSGGSPGSGSFPGSSGGSSGSRSFLGSSGGSSGSRSFLGSSGGSSGSGRFPGSSGGSSGSGSLSGSSGSA